MKHLLKLALVVVLCTLTGCASIVSGGPQAIPINSTPSGAKLEITDISNGTCLLDVQTPYTATLKRSSGFFQKGKYKIKLTKEGSIPQEKIIEAGLNGWYLGNIVFGGLIGILIVDPATGAMWKLDETPINIAMYPDTPDGKIAMAKAEEEVKVKATTEEKENNSSPGGIHN